MNYLHVCATYRELAFAVQAYLADDRRAQYHASSRTVTKADGSRVYMVVLTDTDGDDINRVRGCVYTGVTGCVPSRWRDAVNAMVRS